MKNQNNTQFRVWIKTTASSTQVIFSDEKPDAAMAHITLDRKDYQGCTRNDVRDVLNLLLFTQIKACGGDRFLAVEKVTCALNRTESDLIIE